MLPRCADILSLSITLTSTFPHSLSLYLSCRLGIIFHILMSRYPVFFWCSTIFLFVMFSIFLQRIDWWLLKMWCLCFVIRICALLWFLKRSPTTTTTVSFCSCFSSLFSMSLIANMDMFYSLWKCCLMLFPFMAFLLNMYFRFSYAFHISHTNTHTYTERRTSHLVLWDSIWLHS